MVRGSGDENNAVAMAKLQPLREVKRKQKVSSVARHFTERPLPAPDNEYDNGDADNNDYDDNDDNNNIIFCCGSHRYIPALYCQLKSYHIPLKSDTERRTRSGL
jgi:hypothetical protein